MSVDGLFLYHITGKKEGQGILPFPFWCLVEQWNFSTMKAMNGSLAVHCFFLYLLFIVFLSSMTVTCKGWSGGAMVLGKLPVPGRPTIWITVGQGPTALTVGAGGGCLDIFTLIYPFSPLSPSLWETARYRLKYCLKGPLNPKRPTDRPVTCILNPLHPIFTM